MRFHVSKGWSSTKPKTEFPIAVLNRDNWDDFGWKTLFDVTLWLTDNERVTLENVKILNTEQEYGPTDLPERFSKLPPHFCSLGQETSYYETLQKLDASIRNAYLSGINDIVYDPGIHAQFKEHRGFIDSLVRFSNAERALIEGPKLLTLGPSDNPNAIERYAYQIPGESAHLDLDFGGMAELPDRIHALIGYNGAGKTNLLADFAFIAYSDPKKRRELDFIEEHGSFVGREPQFGGVIAVSYSAFDDFELPAISSQGGEQDKNSVRSYKYCGLRLVDEDGSSSGRLKSLDELQAEFLLAREQALSKLRKESLESVLSLLVQEPSFRLVGQLPDPGASEEEWSEAFARCSTGHKIVLHIAVNLCAHINTGSLILFDEPEMHLHPPLLAALVRALNHIIGAYSGYALIATHSPVVLQEVPSRNVSVLRRVGEQVTIEKTSIETFGESVGLLTRHVFNLDSSTTDFEATLRELSENRSVEEIEELFGSALSSQARSLITAYQYE